MAPLLKKHQFSVIIERDEDGFFVASVPALPGCVTQAKTYLELRERVQEAIQLCLDMAKTNPSYRKKIREFSYNPSFVGMELMSI